MCNVTTVIFTCINFLYLTSYRTTDASHDGNTHIPSIEPIPAHRHSFDHPHSASPVQHNSEHSLSERQPRSDAQRHDFHPLESRSHSNSPHPGSYACDPQNDPTKDPHTENEDNHSELYFVAFVLGLFLVTD